MSNSVTIASNFTSHGKESLGFYDNVDKIIKWRKKYKFPEGVEELLDTLNYCGYARTYCPDRAFFAAYVLSKEGYEVTVQ
jgi:hypothetical protein